MTKIEKLSQLLGSLEMMDLSHLLEENMPAWPTHSKFMHNIWSSLELGDPSTNYLIMMNEHNGTHIDMPSHVIPSGERTPLTTETMPIDQFFGLYKKMNCSHFEKGQILEKQDIVDWEEENKPISVGDIILIDFGWSKYWKLKPMDKGYLDNWPGIGASAANYFVEKKIKLVGVDTLAADVYKAKGNPAHQILLSHNICIMENVNNLDKINNEGYFMVQPLKIKDGSASPIRPFAIYEK